MVEKKVGPSDFHAEVERLQAEGRFPALGEVLDAVADARKKYAAKILKAHQFSDPASKGTNAGRVRCSD